MCPIFDGFQSNCFTRYQKSLWGCSFGYKILLNFTCLTLKFHNYHHANVQEALGESQNDRGKNDTPEGQGGLQNGQNDAKDTKGQSANNHSQGGDSDEDLINR